MENVEKKEKEAEVEVEFTGWDQEIGNIDFFGEKLEKTSTIDTAFESLEGKEEDVEKKTTKAKEPETDVFADITGAGSDEEGGDTLGLGVGDDSTSIGKVSSSVSTLEFLKANGYVDYEVEEGTEITEDVAKDLLADSYESSVDAKVKEVLKELPAEVRALVEVASKGGDVNSLLSVYSSQTNSSIGPDSDITDVKVQENVIRQGLDADGYDADYIESNLEYLKDSGKLEQIARVHHKKIVETNKKAAEAYVLQAEERKKAEKADRKAMKARVATFLKESEEVKGLPITKEDRESIPTYMSDKTVRLENGNYITEMQRDLYTSLQDEESAMFLAKIFKSKLSLEAITTMLETKITGKVKKSIEKGSPVPTGSKRGSQPKQLADYL